MIELCNIEINHRNSIIEEIASENQYLRRKLKQLGVKISLLEQEIKDVSYGTLNYERLGLQRQSQAGTDGRKTAPLSRGHQGAEGRR